jgi:hypothetical protein
MEEEQPSKKLKPYSFLHPHLKRRHDEIISNAGLMAIRRANILQVLTTDLGILTVHRRPTLQEIDGCIRNI